LSLFALAVVAAIRSRLPRTSGQQKGGNRLIGLSVPEVRKIILKLVWAAVSLADEVLAWSIWRRPQYRARACHSRKQKVKPTDQ
jgi:hypothetical protein